jgi:cell division protein FtsI/penicillin-binding protein 2
MALGRSRLFQKGTHRGGEIQPEEIFADTLARDEFDTERFEGRIEFGLTRVPFRIGVLAVAFGILTLLVRVGVLQIARGQAFFDRAENNHVFSVLLPAPRGIIFDRNMKELVKNTPVFEAVLQPSELPDTENERLKLLSVVAATLNLPESELTEAGFDPAKEKAGFKGEIMDNNNCLKFNPINSLKYYIDSTKRNSNNNRNINITSRK